MTKAQLAQFQDDRNRVTVPADERNMQAALDRLKRDRLVVGVFIGLAAAWTLATLSILTPERIPILVIVASISTVFVVLTLIWFASRVHTHPPNRWPWTRWFRLSRFAVDNGLLYVPESWGPAFVGSLFSLSTTGTSVATDRLISSSGRPFEIGNFKPGPGEIGQRPGSWGYLAIGLERALPHILLRSRANQRAGRGLQSKILKDQALALEGDFNRYFTLYAPRAYEADALYVFAPDLMAVMIDEAKDFDVEIVDQWIYFYRPGGFDLTSRRTLRGLFRIARVVGSKTLRQTLRYRDERGGAFEENLVGVGGRRLEVRVTVGVIATCVIIYLVLQRLQPMVDLLR